MNTSKVIALILFISGLLVVLLAILDKISIQYAIMALLLLILIDRTIYKIGT